MAARKKTTMQPPSAADFTIVLEDLRSQFKVFGEALEVVREEGRQSSAGLRQEMRESIGAFRQEVGQAISAFREEVGQAIGAFREEVRGDFKEVDRRLGALEGEMGLVKEVVIEHGRGLKELRAAVERLTEKVDRKVDRAEVVAIVEEVIARPRSH
jgi:archaellum component FlaC